MRILLVDDDVKISSFVKLELEDNGYTVEVAYDSTMGSKLALEKKYDVMILDVVLPGISGFELCKKIRNNGNQTPVLMLTSLDSTEDKVEGFDCGADDYLLKPFSFPELFARLKALIRRNNKNLLAHPIVKIADLELDSISKKVMRNKKEIKLTAREYKLLELFINNKDKVMDRVDIAEKIWGFTFNTGTNVIDVHVNSLRNKIDKGFPKKLIHTLIGIGYVMKED